MWSRELFCKAGKRILVPAPGQRAPVAAAQRLATRAAGEFSASGDEVGDRNADVFDRELKSKQVISKLPCIQSCIGCIHAMHA
jgi:hypothetical protein